MEPDLTQQIIQTVLAIAVAVLTPLVTMAAIQLLRKLGLQLSAENQAKLEHEVKNALLFAEEWGAARIKANIPTTGKEKLETAVARVIDRVPGVTQEEAITLAHTLLPKIGAGAAVALGEVKRAATNEVR